MEEAKVTSKGQITIPKKIREKLNINPGDKLTFKENEEGEWIIKSNKKSILRLAGILHRPNQKKLTVEEMNQAVKEAVAEKYKKDS
ncbi:AbrB/MazE/SpoVT family DNA-binding domain-containing protein [Fodinibius sp.]|uniref:AbrB/MazE/SpoVT family DNA-binding domain-containing protein n=1 Tax=Fodinibius sp. TaxID=1872440 RepID=UPI002ACD944D|nr:AbrB/MazE/SpoVT family DNA-binding domain-containing protein [Fodinibius sp.]MDZ7658318.1 AbrB/MazE/SpoVT family DNA-binding domain-containing protein [Fodinibius sp.]